MTLSTQLWSENSDLASEALTHPFVCRLGDGSLAREISTGYLVPGRLLSGVLRPRLRPGPCSQPRHTHAARVGRSARRGNPPAAKDRARVTSIAHQILARLIATPG